MNQLQPFKDHIYSLIQDAVLWKAKKLYDPAASPDDKQKGIDGICAMLGNISNEVKRDSYLEMIVTTCKIKKSHITNGLKNYLNLAEDLLLGEDEATHKLPDWANKERVYNYALDWREEQGPHTGIYFTQSGNQLVQMTNFVIKPLFHLFDMAGNTRRLALLHSHFKSDALIELPSKVFTSLDKFEETLLDRGNYHTMEGFGKPQLKRLFRAIGNQFPFAYELKYLGWQGEGFWSYADAVYDGEKLTKYSDLGIVKVRDKHYYSPAGSNLYKSDRVDEDGREVMDDDPYENDKYISYQKSPVTFSDWSKMMITMHGDAGMVLITYAFISLFKDIITSYEKIPLIYGYGLVQSGKSTWAEGLYYLFYDKNSKPFNLNQGTVFAFFNRMERFRNCPQLFNEFDEDAIDEDYFRAFKAFYDGEGRDRGKGIKGKTETQKINCTVILTGQTLTTKDGASVLMRSIPVKFNDKGERTDEEKKNYDTWYAWTQKGMNGCLVEALSHRKNFKANFFQNFNEELVKIKSILREEGEPFKERIVKNYTILLATGKVMMEHMQLGFTYNQLFNYCKQNIVSLSRMISEVDNLATFWNTLEFLYERGDILDGIDFKIEEQTSYRKIVGKDNITIPLDKPTKIIYMRLVKAYPLYAQNFRQTTGGKPINQQTLITYFESSKHFLGNNSASRFDAPGGKSINTSSFMFDYSKIGINMERFDNEVTDDRIKVTMDLTISKNAELKELNQKFMIVFSAYYFESTKREGSLDRTEKKYINCYSTDTDLINLLVAGSNIKVTGMFREKKVKEFTNRHIDIDTIEFKETPTAAADTPAAEEMPF